MTANPSDHVTRFSSLLPIRAKLALVGLAVAAATALAGVVSYRIETETAARSKYLYDNILQSVNYARLGQTEFERLRIIIRQCASVRDAVEGVQERGAARTSRFRGALMRNVGDPLCDKLSREAGARNSMTAAGDRLKEVIANLSVAADRDLNTEATRELGLELDADADLLVARLQDLAEPAMKVLEGDQAAAPGVMSDMDDLAEAIDLFIQDLAAAGAAEQLLIEERSRQGGRRILTAVALAVVIGLIASAVIGEWIARQIRFASRFAQGVAGGALDGALDVRGRTELSALMRSLDDMRAEIRTRIEQIEALRDRSERMVDNMLPAAIAERMRAGETQIADGRAEATIVFIDIVGFTNLTRRVGASHLVETLNGVFSAMDEAAEACGVDKIKTIGDAYMAAAGVVAEPSEKDAERCARFALQAREIVAEAGERLGYPLQIRAGVHNGPAVAGVLGKSRLVFDIWGEAVNLASRLEASGAPGEIRVSEPCYWRLRGLYDFDELGSLELKGVGAVPIFRLVGEKGAARAAPASSGKVVPIRKAD